MDIRYVINRKQQRWTPNTPWGSELRLTDWSPFGGRINDTEIDPSLCIGRLMDEGFAAERPCELRRARALSETFHCPFGCMISTTATSSTTDGFLVCPPHSTHRRFLDGSLDWLPPIRFIRILIAWRLYRHEYWFHQKFIIFKNYAWKQLNAFNFDLYWLDGLCVLISILSFHLFEIVLYCTHFALARAKMEFL